MKLHPVQSSQIEAIGHDPATNTLAIRFKSRAKGNGVVNGSTYHYSNVTKDDYMKLRTAESVGSHFHKHIKPHPTRYPFTKIDN